MGKARITPLAAALKLVDQLSSDERQTLYDYLRPERKVKAQGKSSSSALPARRKSSSGNAPQTGTGANLGTGMESAGVAAAGSSAGGD